MAAPALLLPVSAQAQSDADSEEASDFPASAPEYTLDYARDNFGRFYDSGEYVEAIDAGKLVIDVLLRLGDVDQIEWAEALSRLASAQRLAGEYDPAMQNYQAALAVIEDATNRLSPHMVDPLLGLSRTLADAGALEEAVESYDRTLHVQQVNRGLHSIEQSAILTELSEVHFAMGNSKMADAMQQANVNLANRNYPGDDLRRLPAMYGRADMLERIGNHIKAHERYRRIIDLIERAEGSKTLTLLPALYKIADVFLYNEILDGYKGAEQARRYLRRAVVVVERNDDASAVQKANAYIAMADYLNLKSSNRGVILREYRKAWDLLSGDERLLAERDKRFMAPVALNDVPGIRTPAFSKLIDSATDAEETRGVVVLSYDVDKYGYVKDVQVVESDPPGHGDSVVMHHLERILFRPRFVDRSPVETVDNRYEVRFNYFPVDWPGESSDVAIGDASD